MKMKPVAAVVLVAMLGIEPAAVVAADPPAPERAAAGAATPDSATNAATLYRQAFTQLPNDGADARMLDQWDTLPTGPAMGDMLLRRKSCLDLLHRAAAMSRCDWKTEYSNAGMNALLQDLSGARSLARLAAMRARYWVAQNRGEEAIRDLAVVAALARHVAAEPIVVSRTSAISIEVLSITQAAHHLPQLPLVQQAILASQLDRLPAMPGLADTVRAEKKYASSVLQGAPALVARQRMDAFYDRLAEAMALPPDQFSEGWAEVQKEAQRTGPMAGILVPSMLRVRQTDDRIQAMRAMLKAAIAVQHKGPEALKGIKDPFGDGPFEYVESAGGFELRSKLQDRGKPVSLVVGR